MTTETGCRVSAEELKHDRDAEERHKRRMSAYVDRRQDVIDTLTAGEIGEAIADCPSDEVSDRLIIALQKDDFEAIGVSVSAMVMHWVMTQANKSVERMIDRGDL